MDSKAETKEFLTSRRARLTPQEVGLIGAGRRRVPGLRRSEVADLAGVSVEYYAQLERGGLAGASEAVLEALARALRLDDAERGHLWDLARAATPTARRTRTPQTTPPRAVRPSVARLLALTPAVPVLVLDARLDVVAVNPLGGALFAPVLATTARPAGWSTGRPVNTARFTFLDDRARDFWVDWETAADDAVSQLRTEAGRHPHDPALTGLVGELSTRSEAFRTRWAAHNVRLHLVGTKQLRHPVVGRIDLDFDVLELPADPGLSMVAFTARAGSPADDALQLLAVHALAPAPPRASTDVDLLDDPSAS